MASRKRKAIVVDVDGSEDEAHEYRDDPHDEDYQAEEGNEEECGDLNLPKGAANEDDSDYEETQASKKKRKKEKKDKKDRSSRRPKHSTAPSTAAPTKSRSGSTRTSSAAQSHQAVTTDEEDFVPNELEEEAYVSDLASTNFLDFSALMLKEDHQNRPLWVCPDGRVFLEAKSRFYKQAYDFLIAIAEPVCRPDFMHEYMLTPHSLYAAVSVGLGTNTILQVLGRLSKTQLPEEVKEFVRASTQNYGKVKLVLRRNAFFVESSDPAILRRLLEDDVIASARIQPTSSNGTDDFERNAAPEQAHLPEADAGLEADDTVTEKKDAVEEGRPDAAAGEPQTLLSFQIKPELVEHVKQRCLPNNLNYPMMEEYDFRNDTTNPDLNIDLKPMAKLRPYQEKSLSKMFGNGRSRSGIIVLPCGAGKSLTGVAAATRIKKSVLCLCTSSVSVDQWRQQFRMWSTISEKQCVRFIAESKEMFSTPSGVLVTTYNMIAFNGHRSDLANEILEEIKSREWGLLLMDEVHVVPAHMFRKVISLTKSHCKLGLTATLVREDERISDLNFLIGPKLYEANWLDLQRDGHIANVQCAEVWCPMTKEFYTEYLNPDNKEKRQLLYTMNPNKFKACEFLLRYHEQRGDKIIVFSDNIFALKDYAIKLKRFYIYGPTALHERTRVLYAFKHSAEVRSIFISKVGDNSIDIPEANVIIQISSHAGSRRQEAQRLGRILRAKQGTKKDEFNAFFYSLVSTDTTEMVYSTKRQQFLIDQGYAFKVINQLPTIEDGSGMYSTKEEQLELLTRVLAAGDEEAGVEVLKEDAEVAMPKARRVTGSMRGLTGAEGMVYMEFAGAQGPKARGGANPKQPAHSQQYRPRSNLFRSRFR